jgi:hypothetical protein
LRALEAILGELVAKRQAGWLDLGAMADPTANRHNNHRLTHESDDTRLDLPRFA